MSNLQGKCITPTVLGQKVDAFVYMMNSRHKRFGTNLPGKEINFTDFDDSTSDKRKLHARKQLLENWAELKGASKQKEYDERGTYINHKLKQRSNKLKKMLNINSKCHDELILSKKRKHVVESDEDGQDFCNNSLEQESNRIKNSKTRKAPVTKKKKSMAMESNSDSSEDEQINVKSTSKQWIIKIKLDAGDQEYTEILEDKKNEDVLESNCGKMVLRARNPKQKLSEEVLTTPNHEFNTKKKRPLKLAPVFLKTTPKPKLDPEIVEARRQFLLSGVPDSLKMEMEKQQGIEELDLGVFPVVSHVQQKTDYIFWNLPKVNIAHLLTDNEPLKMENDLFSLANSITINSRLPRKYECTRPDKFKKYGKMIKVIKSQNPDYPVYKVFKSLYKKSGYNSVQKKSENIKHEQNNMPKRRNGKKISLKNNVNIVYKNHYRIEENLAVYAMWTEKYKPKTSDEIIGNRKSIASLKEWLTNWLSGIDENKEKTNGYDSESDFIFSESDSSDSVKLYNNTLILKGPHGSGKTSAVHAVCSDLGLNVLEVNASSKRTGKWLLQELQEATQSHQVRKKENILSFAKEPKEKSVKQRTCVLLVEDVDIVFEQDEGFIAALMQIMATSKRPIILTTTDEIAPNLEKMISSHQIISFSSFSSIVSIWLQIICLIEGCYVTINSLEKLLNYNRGDIRKTLLYLQYWTSSGGRLNNNESKEESSEIEIVNDELIIGGNLNMSDLKLEELRKCDTFHSVDIDSFETVQNYNMFKLPHRKNLEIVWWNLSDTLNLPNFSNFRLNRDHSNCHQSLEHANSNEKGKLNTLSEFYDSLAFVDTVCNRNEFHESLEPMWHTKPKDSLQLEESIICYNHESFTNDLANNTLSGRIAIYKEKFENTHSSVNMAMPLKQELEWYRQQSSCEKQLKEALLDLIYLEHKSVTLDYMPALRSIVRTEVQCALSGTKRRNRFYSYLRSLGLYNAESTYKIVSDTFKACF